MLIVVRALPYVRRKRLTFLGAESDDYVSKHVSSVRTIESFLMCLTNADLEGRVVLALSGNAK